MEKRTIRNLDRAYAHPIRKAVLLRLVELNGRVESPTQLANQFDMKVGNMAYHIKILKEMGLIELKDTAPRRGATEHFYAIAPGLAKETTASLALDAIADLLEGVSNGTVPTVEVAKIIRATGRPIELAVEGG